MGLVLPLARQCVRGRGIEAIEKTLLDWHCGSLGR